MGRSGAEGALLTPGLLQRNFSHKSKTRLRSTEKPIKECPRPTAPASLQQEEAF